jgi:MFS family permease
MSASRGAVRLVRVPAVRRLLAVGVALALVTVSDAFVFLALQRRFDFGIEFFPLLFVGSALAYMLLAIPAGRLADRLGRVRVFLMGHLVLVALYVLLLSPGLGAVAVVLALALLGAFYAATDGVLMAQASVVLPERLRASGLALLMTGTTLARLVASLAFGAAWTAFGLQTAIAVFAGGLAAAIVWAALVLRSSAEQAYA